ncbi:hypothetical protein FRC11_012471 [Ceratobasidium sp. 423]|nr:hypothetical protein FRC11_012471 [Ceratobasidium sp. 423]
MEIMLGEQEQMIFDQKLGARYDPVPVPGLVPRANLKPGVEGDSALEARVIKGVSGLPVRGSLRVVERSTKSPRATDIPLPPSPPPAGATLEHTLEEPVHHVHPDSSTVDIDSTPVTLPPSPFLEESC